MFTHNLNPVLLDLGPLEVRYYGLVYAFGFILTYIFLVRNRKSLKASKQQIENLIMWLIIGLIAGARLFHFIFSEPLVLLRNPLEFFMVWHGGMSFFGGLIGAFLCAFLYIRKHRMNWKKVADIVIIPALIALILGRIANFINGELVGTASQLPWCVVFPMVDSICRHPYQIYAAFSHLILLFGLLVVREKVKKAGFVFYSFLAGYGFLRLITDFFRDDIRFLGLTIWQYMSIALFVLGTILLIKQTKK